MLRKHTVMRSWTLAVLPLALVITGFASAQPPKNSDEPKPGTRGNPDNVPYIGKSDPKGNPARLARATGHVSNDSEDTVHFVTTLTKREPGSNGEPLVRRAQYQVRRSVAHVTQ
jgi:hypothetical protein